MLSAERRILFFDGNQLTALFCKAGKLSVEDSFWPDPAGLESLAAYVAAHRKSLFYLLADVSEEGFQLETVPYVRGRDRAALLKRRLAQYYYGTPLSVAISLGRTEAAASASTTQGEEQKSNRRDEQILFAALTRPETLQPWLDVFAGNDVPLAGLYSTPLILAHHTPSFIGKRQTCLLITLSSGGLRQTYFEHGKMHFSRLTPLISQRPTEVATACQMEANKTYQYLVGERQIKRGTPLSTVIVANSDLADVLQSACASTAEIDFEINPMAALARSAGLKTLPDDSRIDFLLAHRLVTKPPRYQFAERVHRRMYRLWLWRRGLNVGALAMLTAGFLLGARLTAQWWDMSQQTQLLQQQAASDTQRYQSLLTSLPPIPLGHDDLRTAIAGFEHLQKRADGFAPLLAHLGKVLTDTPAVELKQLGWTLSQNFGAANANPSTPGAPVPGRPLPSASPTAKPLAWHLVDIEGRLPAAMATDQRAMIELIDRLAARLQHDGIEVQLTKRPIDVESAKTYRSGGAASTDPEAATPHFSMRIGKGVAP